MGVSIPFRGFHGDNAEAWNYNHALDMFQSPFGDSMGITFFQYARVQMKNVSIPFRGFHGDNELRATEADKVHVSIPFRGFHGDNAAYQYHIGMELFQSPFGDSMGITTKYAPELISSEVSIPFRGFHGDN